MFLESRIEDGRDCHSEAPTILLAEGRVKNNMLVYRYMFKIEIKST